MIKKTLITLMCIFNLSAYAYDDIPQKDTLKFREAINIKAQHSFKKISDTVYVDELLACSNRDNTYCSAFLGDWYFSKELYYAAFPLLLKATNKLHLTSPYFDLAEMYANGLGVIKNNDVAIHYYKKSLHTKMFNPEISAYNIGDLYRENADKKNHLKEKEITENLKKSYAWYKVSQLLGYKVFSYKSPKNNHELSKDITININELMSILIKHSALEEADVMAHHICAEIPDCKQRDRA